MLGIAYEEYLSSTVPLVLSVISSLARVDTSELPRAYENNITGLKGYIDRERFLGYTFET